MTPADVVALGAFFVIVIAGLAVRTLRAMARQRPASRIQSRVAAFRDPRDGAKPKRAEKPRHELLHKRFSASDQAVLAAFTAWRERVRTVAGTNGMRTLGLAAAAAFIVCFVGSSFLGLSALLRLAASVGVAFVALRSAYAWMVASFRQRFLNQFPDTLDLIIRAVRAGIPVVQAVCTAGVESEEPVRATFRSMGDALLVGAELKDVLELAAQRLQLADFSFFTVCLILQRETGGNLGDTLENLASIVRTRRDIRAKSKALTAEGRLASKMIAAVPFVMFAFMFLVDRAYVELLTNTRAGHKILVTAAALMTVGLWMIRKISNLDTSR